MKPLITGSLVALLLTSSSAFALGEAGSTWLKLKFTATGVQANDTDGTLSSRKTTSGTCYALLNYAVDTHTYTAPVYCQDDTLTYAQVTTIYLNEMTNGNAAYNSNQFTRVKNRFGHVIQGYGNHMLSIKKDKAGNFRNATLKSVFATNGSTMDPVMGYLLLGSFTINGTSIPASKLPFTPPT